MKLKLLIFFLSLFFFAEKGEACPVWLAGKIRIVDENNNVIHNAKLWSYRSLNDSFLRKKGDYDYDSDARVDTSTYFIYEGGGWRIWETDYKKADKEYLITADGYADVILKNVNFEWGFNDTVYSTPTLVITMYGQKYKKVNNSIALYDRFFVDKTVTVERETTLAWKDYVGDENDINNGFGKDVFTKVTTYPNPVVKGLHIKINYTITSPLVAKISDIQGKLVEQLLIENNEIDWDLQWQKAGNYFLTIYDEGNKPIHTQLIAKQ